MDAPQDIDERAHPRDLPLYTVADAAHYLHMPPSTLRSWVMGRSYRTDGAEVFSSR